MSFWPLDVNALTEAAEKDAAAKFEKYLTPAEAQRVRQARRDHGDIE